MRVIAALAAALIASAQTGCASSPAQRLGLPSTASPAELDEAMRLSRLALERWIGHEIRLQSISQRIRIAGSELCEKDRGPVVGVAVSGRRVVPPSHAGAAELRFIDDAVYVMKVFPGMAAERAGLQEGDALLSIGSRRVWSESEVYRASASDAATIPVRVARHGRTLELDLPNEPGCAYPARLAIIEVVNASARASAGLTTFNTALMRAIPSEEQLAFVVAHEIGHIILDHTGGSNDRRAEEAQADYFGAYLTVRAGYPLDDDDVRVFDALVLGDVNAIDRQASTHPVTPARTFALRETLAEIEGKKQAGTPLLPSGKSPLIR